ncbi:MAG: hypothetical protein SGJ18_13775 [Pseudomonadota bacterium]|nr:hypothetical protein [Pseudomonadota bacterium]
MKKIVMIGLAIVGMSFETHADPAFPRDLTCVTNSGDQITLSSNNGQWSQAQNGRYNVKLLVTQGGQTETLAVSSVNNRAQHVRGNDEGLREYVFISKNGEEVKLSLEFNAPYGLATSIKTFLGVTSAGAVLVDAKRDSCEVIFYDRIEI